MVFDNKAYMQEYNEKNKEKLKQQKKEYYLKNREKILENNKEYRKNNAELIKEYRKNNKRTIKKHRKRNWKKHKQKYNLERRLDTMIKNFAKGKNYGEIILEIKLTNSNGEKSFSESFINKVK